MSTMITRRGLLLGATVGAAALATTAPALAADPVFDAAFLRRDESADYSGSFDVSAMLNSQVDNAKFIMALGKGHDVPRFGIEIALATAIQESTLVNLYPAVDHDSRGLFQQQPATGWGTAEQVTDKLLATKAFWGIPGSEHTVNNGLMQIQGWQSMPLWQAASAVQHPREDLQQRYQDWAVAAADIYDTWGGEVAPYRG